MFLLGPANGLLIELAYRDSNSKKCPPKKGEIEFMQIEAFDIELKERTFLVRSPDAKDVPELQEYYRHIFAESEFLFSSSNSERTTEDWVQGLNMMAQNPRGLLVTIYEGSKIIGFGNLLPSSLAVYSQNVELGTSLRKSHRGIGLGRLLVKLLLENARKFESVKRVNISVVKQNIGAIKLYEQMGFVHEGVRANAIVARDTFYDEVLMGYQIR